MLVCLLSTLATCYHSYCVGSFSQQNLITFLSYIQKEIFFLTQFGFLVTSKYAQFKVFLLNLKGRKLDKIRLKISHHQLLGNPSNSTCCCLFIRTKWIKCYFMKSMAPMCVCYLCSLHVFIVMFGGQEKTFVLMMQHFPLIWRRQQYIPMGKLMCQEYLVKNISQNIF